MTLNCQMSKDAAAYAQKLAEMGTLVKSSYTERPEQGENLSLGCYKDREETAEEAVKMWYVNVQEPLPINGLLKCDILGKVRMVAFRKIKTMNGHLSKTCTDLCRWQMVVISKTPNLYKKY